jgi:hypothetical protein
MESNAVLEARARTGDLDALFRVGHRLAYGRNRRLAAGFFRDAARRAGRATG